MWERGERGERERAARGWRRGPGHWEHAADAPRAAGLAIVVRPRGVSGPNPIPGARGVKTLGDRGFFSAGEAARGGSMALTQYRGPGGVAGGYRGAHPVSRRAADSVPPASG